jgi:hypothetical protein
MLKKQKHPSKEELLRQAELEAETKRTRNKIKDEIYPILNCQSKNIEHAKMVCQIVAASLRQAFNNKANSFSVLDMNLSKDIDLKHNDAGIVLDVLNVIKDEKLPVGISMLDGLANEIDRLIKKEVNERSLDTLKTDWIEDDKK